MTDTIKTEYGVEAQLIPGNSGILDGVADGNMVADDPMPACLLTPQGSCTNEFSSGHAGFVPTTTAATIRAVQGLLDWIAEVPPLIGIAVLTFLPLLELRASIPYGLLATPLPWWVVFIAAVAINWLVAPVVYLFLKYALQFLLRNAWFARIWECHTERTQKRISRAVDTWGTWGLAVFIGIPLPGSGVYTGALGAYLLGMGFRRFMWVALAGVLIAATAVTIIVMSGAEALSLFYSSSAVEPH